MNYDSLFSGIDFTSLNAQSSNSSPVNSTISNSNMNNNGNMIQPLNTNHNIQQFDQQQFAMGNNGISLPSSLSDKDREIYHKNNLRLQEMEREIRIFHTYGNACDELLAWLNDDRAYNKMNETALVACIVAIYEKHVEHGRWSGMQILKTASERCGGLTDKARAIIKKCHNEASNSLTPRRPSESSITSTGSGNLTMTNSPASLRSSSNLNTPQSPNTSTEFFQTTNFQSLVKNLLGTNVTIAPSPTLSTSSPLASPRITGSDINNMQQKVSPQVNHAGVPPNTVLNDQSNAIRSNQQLSKQQQMQIALSQQQQQQQQQQKKHAIQQQMLQQHQIQQQMLHKQQLEQQQRQQQMQQVQQQQQQQQLKQQHQQQQQNLLIQQQQLRMQQNAAYQQYYAQQPAQAQPQPQSQYNGRGPAHVVCVPQQNGVPVSPTGHNQVYYIPSDDSRTPQQQPQIRQQEVTPVLQMLNQSHPAAQAAQAVMNQRQQQQPVHGPTIVTSGASHTPAAVTSTGYAPPISIAIAPEIIAAASQAIASIISAPVQQPASTVVSSHPSAIHVPHNQVPSPNISSPVAPNNRVALPQRTQTTLTASGQYRLPNRPASPTTRLPNTTTTTTGKNQDLYLPSLPQVSSDQIQLPGGNKRHKVYDSEKDKAKFRFSKEYAMKPFRLVHDQSVTKKFFYVDRPDFDLLCLNEDMFIQNLDKDFPLTFIFTSWYNNTPERKCDWPNALRVELNGKDLPLEKRVRHRINSQNHSYTGKDLPFDLTKLIRLGENVLIIHQIGCACSYNFSVQIHKRHSDNSLHYLIEKSFIDIQTSESLIDSLLGNSGSEDDDEIVIIQESVKVSLKCPITMKRIKMPVRGKDCRHVDCFDLNAYLLMNENKNPSWICPRCNSLAYPDSLARDLLMESLLKKLPKNVSEIEYKENHKNFKITKVDDPDTDDEGDDDKDVENSDVNVGDSIMKDGSGTVKNEEFAITEVPALTNVIDLISDDEDEEEHQAGIETTTTTNNNHVVTTTTTSIIVIPPFKRPRQE